MSRDLLKFFCVESTPGIAQAKPPLNLSLKSKPNMVKGNIVTAASIKGTDAAGKPSDFALF